jgi:parallel beta-helix repeat protein
MDYGARADGVSDDAAAVQRAVDACAAAGGGTVYMPAGTYRLYGGRGINPDCGANIELKNGVHIRGAGPGRTVVRATRSDYHPFAATQKTNIGVSNLEIYATAGRIDGCKMYACRNVTIDNVTAHDLYIGLALYSCSDSTVSNCTAYDCSGFGITVGESELHLQIGGVDQDTDNVIVRDCLAYSCGTSALRCAGYPPAASTDPRRVSSVTWQNCTGRDSYDGLFMSYASDITVSGCTTTGNSNVNVKVWGVWTALIQHHTYGGDGGSTPSILTSTNDPSHYATYGSSTDISVTR